MTDSKTVPSRPVAFPAKDRRRQPDTAPPSAYPLEDLDHKAARADGVLTSARWFVRERAQR